MIMSMTKKTAKRLTARLVQELKDHPHRDEIVCIALEQLMEDC